MNLANNVRRMFELKDKRIEELEAVVMSESQKSDLLSKEHYRDEIVKLQAQLEAVRGLLKVAICPECDGGGVVCTQYGSDDNYEIHQCQWCYEREAALNGEDDGHS
jgi:hypothetical protein